MSLINYLIVKFEILLIDSSKNTFYFLGKNLKIIRSYLKWLLFLTILELNGRKINFLQKRLLILIAKLTTYFDIVFKFKK